MSLEELRARGWCISQDGLDTIKESLEKENPTVDDIIAAAVDASTPFNAPYFTRAN